MRSFPIGGTVRPAGRAALLPTCAILAALAAAGTWSIRTGWADYRFQQKTIAGTEAAIGLAPDSAQYFEQLAMLVSGDDPPRAKDALRRAVDLNPWDAGSWIDLGLRAESEGDTATAKLYLLRAADVDREYLPRWTLANYYFRRDDLVEFWHWAKEAAGMAYGDMQPFFRLCGRVEEDGKLIDRLGILNPDVRASYLSYLLGQKRVDLIGPAVHRLLKDNREADVPLLLAACERLLETMRVDDAIDLWRRMAEVARVPGRAGAGKGGQLLVNGDFATAPTSRGFDWRLSGADGITVSREEDSQGLRITFSGREPEDCEALVQWVAVQGNAPYELQLVYRTSWLAPGAGLAWRFTDTNGAPLGEGPSLAAEAATEQRLRFDTPPKCRLVRVSLRYHRAPGTTRLEGFVVLQNVAMRPAAHAPTEGSRVR